MGEYFVAFFLGGVAGIVIGLIVGRMSNSKTDVVDKLQSELNEAKTKLKEQTEHFAESENMLHKIGTDLKDLYHHMSKNEVSTLKEKFKGLVIDADKDLEILEHKAEDVMKDLKVGAKVVGEQLSASADKIHETYEEKDGVKEEKAQDAPKVSDEASPEVTPEAPAKEEELVKDEPTEETVQKTAVDKDQLDKTIDDLAEKDKK